tara:strand:- start:7 stop:270 length:264 start_codon:yes stop_codon:yes gene_type:complete
MLNKIAFANALAALVAIVYIVSYVLLFTARPMFDFIMNAKFLGGDFASKIPAEIDVVSAATTLVAMAVAGWIVGYIWSFLYNMFAKR